MYPQTQPCPKHTHRPKLEDRHWYNFKALLKWPDNLGRWVGLGHGHVWATTSERQLLSFVI